MGPLFSVVAFSIHRELAALYIREWLVFRQVPTDPPKAFLPPAKPWTWFAGDSWLRGSEATDFSLHSSSVFLKF